MRTFLVGVLAALLLAGCAAQRPAMTAAEARSLISAYLPPTLADKDGWAADIHTPMAVLELPLTPDNICAIVSVVFTPCSGAHTFSGDPSYVKFPPCYSIDMLRMVISLHTWPSIHMSVILSRMTPSFERSWPLTRRSFASVAMSSSRRTDPR